MKKIIAGVLLATCLAFGREATFGDMLDAIVSFGNGYLEVKNNQGRTIKLPLQLYGYKVMFEGLIDRDKSKQCISYKSLTEAQKARLALWKWSDTIEGRSTYPYQDDRQKQIEREAILLNDIATGTEEYKECQKVVIAKVGETIGKLFSIFRSDKQSPQAITASYQPKATTSYNVYTWANEINKARGKARNTREYKEYLATVEQSLKWAKRVWDSLYNCTPNCPSYEYYEQAPLERKKWEATILKKWEAYEATKEYKAWRALEKQALDSVNSALASTSEYQKAEIARNKAYSTKEYQAMIKAQNAVRATQHYKNIKEIADSGYSCDFDCYGYRFYRYEIRRSKEFLAWEVATKAFVATNEAKSWQVAVKAYQTNKEYKAIELVKKEIRVGIENFINTEAIHIRKSGYSETLSCETDENYCGGSDDDGLVIPKNWEHDLWYGGKDFKGFWSYEDKERMIKEGERVEVEAYYLFDVEGYYFYDWEY